MHETKTSRTSRDEYVQRLQSKLFGEPYRGASLAKFKCDAFEKGTDVKILNWLNKKSGFLMFLGGPGIGKTYLCAAILDWIYEENYPKFSVRYRDESQFFGELKDGMSKGWSDTKHVEYISDDFFYMFDDVGSDSSSEWSLRMFHHFINCRIRTGFPTVITGNLTKEDLYNKFTDRTYDRLFEKSNLIIDCHGASSRRTGILYPERIK